MSLLRQIIEEDPPRLTHTPFLPDPLTTEEAEQLRQWHAEGRPAHEQEVMHLMGRHARTPRMDILERAIAVLDHLRALQRTRRPPT